MIVNARKEAGLRNPTTTLLMELDIYLPSLKLAFEFQVFSLPHSRVSLILQIELGKASLY